MIDQVLLTGAGQVGAQMIQLLNLDYGIKPVVLDIQFDWSYLDTVVDRDSFIAVEGSVLDSQLLRQVMGDYGVRRISHSAAILPMRVGHAPHPGFFEVNVHGTSQVMFAALEQAVDTFVMFSTNGVYQFREYGVTEPVSENYPTGLGVHNSYGNSKAAAEYLLKELTLAGRINGRVIRPGEIYGPVASRSGEEPIYWQAMFNAAMSGESFSLVGHPEHRLDWVYAKDVARAAVAALMADSLPSFAYNVSYGKCMGIYDIKAALDRLYPGNRVTLDHCDRGGWQFPLDNRRMIEELGVAPAFDLEAGIRDYASWFLGPELLPEV
ncbi:NAD-dependent epimerase/dehydratase family protein [Marinobacter xestospongiae]|uniref:SDR family oxidoreductase n=1 Tax=Marinobacter xestospongiae TaxID=994319 RepID=A0ABU3W098_9GAMM|nr:SDR family oxidoreductase [Marinobacter xestospongiae]MDV2079963.1 SDR family oxidoreductase [Marinobacter xestospongiae]